MSGSRLGRAGYRLDIEGLRAVAVVAVLAYHAGLPLISGGFVGVDVFFVISGYLITGLLLREAEARGKVSLVGFYARRARRLLPAAGLVLATSAILTWTLGPLTQRSLFGGDITSAALYLSNWRFAARSIDYLAEDVGPSPVQHFWSLSVEEQFYFLWPLLILVALVLAKRVHFSTRGTASILLAAVAVPSLALSVAASSRPGGEAFFTTTTRLWELAVGALLSAAVGRAEWRRRRSAVLSGSLGILLVIASCTGVLGENGWPGWRALAPVVGAALVILAGTLDISNPISRALSLRAMTWVGGLSYSLYLWHWPILVAGRDWLGLAGSRWSLVLVAATVIPAWISYTFVECPIRDSRILVARPLRSLAMGGAFTAAAATAGLGMILIAAPGVPQLGPDASAGGTAHRAVEAAVVGRGVAVSPAGAGAESLGLQPRTASAGDPVHAYEAMVPTPSEARNDYPRPFSQTGPCIESLTGSSPGWCPIGDPAGAVTFAVLGDSKVAQFGGAIDLVAKARGWSGVQATKSGCPFSDAHLLLDGEPFASCDEFDAAVMETLRASPPDFIIVSQRHGDGYLEASDMTVTRDGGIAGLASRWREVESWGTRVIVILDNPAPPAGVSVYECVAAHLEATDQCAFDRAAAIESSGAPAQVAAAARVTGVRVVDLTDYICPRDRCSAVIGGVLVYRQGSHITNSYALSLAPVLAESLTRAVEDQP